MFAQLATSKWVWANNQVAAMTNSVMRTNYVSSSAGLLLAWLLLALLMLSGAATAGPNWRVEGNSQASEMAQVGGQCVRETDWMRRHHMELISHDRNLTVHQGVRTIDGSLAGCVNCHANKHEDGAAIPVTATQGPDGAQFCASCHLYTGVAMDCFACHSAVPNP